MEEAIKALGKPITLEEAMSVFSEEGELEKQEPTTIELEDAKAIVDNKEE